ncbi:MAG: nuclear transport factor 2 family protein [Reyranella sp.]|nr:nuclear transport factor 2 family protein [Reyranella sp.]
MNRHVETVRRIYGCFAEGDIAGILARLDAAIDWEHDWGSETLAWYQPRRGRAAVAGFFETLADFDFVRFEPRAFLAGGDMVAVPIEVELVVKLTGSRVRDLEVHLWTFGPHGLATRFRHVVDTLQLANATRP